MVVVATTVPQLPDEVLVKIFNYLNADGLTKARLVCSSWNRMADDNSLHRYLVVDANQRGARELWRFARSLHFVTIIGSGCSSTRDGEEARRRYGSALLRCTNLRELRIKRFSQLSASLLAALVGRNADLRCIHLHQCEMVEASSAPNGGLPLLFDTLAGRRLNELALWDVNCDPTEHLFFNRYVCRILVASRFTLTTLKLVVANGFDRSELLERVRRCRNVRELALKFPSSGSDAGVDRSTTGPGAGAEENSTDNPSRSVIGILSANPENLIKLYLHGGDEVTADKGRLLSALEKCVNLRKFSLKGVCSQVITGDGGENLLIGIVRRAPKLEILRYHHTAVRFVKVDDNGDRIVLQSADLAAVNEDSSSRVVLDVNWLNDQMKVEQFTADLKLMGSFGFGLRCVRVVSDMATRRLSCSNKSR